MDLAWCNKFLRIHHERFESSMSRLELMEEIFILDVADESNTEKYIKYLYMDRRALKSKFIAVSCF